MVRQGDLGQVMKIVVDHIHYWEPPKRGHPIDIEAVDKYILDVAKRFHVELITYDQHWSSQASLTKMKNHGLRAICTPYTQSYQAIIFQELYDLFKLERIEFYQENTIYIDPDTRDASNLLEIDEAKSQFTSMQRRWSGGKPKLEAAVGNHDDIPDCIAGAAYQALSHKVYHPYPRSSTRRITGWR